MGCFFWKIKFQRTRWVWFLDEVMDPLSVGFEANRDFWGIAGVSDFYFVTRFWIEMGVANLQGLIDERFGVIQPGFSQGAEGLFVGFIDDVAFFKSDFGRTQTRGVAVEGEPADQMRL